MLDDADRTLLNLLSRELAGEQVILTVTHPDRQYVSGGESAPTLSCYLYDVRELPASPNAPPASPLLPASLFVRLQATWCITVVRAPGQVDTDASVMAEHALLGSAWLALARNPVLTSDVLAGALLAPHASPVGRIVPTPPLGDQFWTAFGLRLRPAIHYAIEFRVSGG